MDSARDSDLVHFFGKLEPKWNFSEIMPLLKNWPLILPNDSSKLKQHFSGDGGMNKMSL